MTPTATIISAGAGLASMAMVAWTIYRARLDRGKLAVSYCGALVGVPPEPVDYRVFKATNVGRRPLVVQSFKVVTKGDQWVLVYADPRDFMFGHSAKLPKRLEEGETAEVYMRSELFKGYEIRSVIAFDSTGKPWKSAEV